METSTANLIALFAAVGTFLAAVSAAITYWRNSQLEKAKWSLSLAFLEKKKQLSCDEIRALFDYYLKCLNRHPRVITFIKENGYEDLQKLLKTWK